MNLRRRLLLGVAGAAGAAGLGLWAFGRTAIEARIASVLRRKLADLKLDEAGVRAFARDQADRIIGKRMTMNRIRYHLTAGSSLSFGRFARSRDTRSRIDRAEDRLVSTFLVSTDFFFHDGDPARTVTYLGYYDAMTRPCSSPFARPITETAPAR